MQQAPNNLIEPQELIDFIKKSAVSEEAATGLRLMRRAAETIAYQQDLLSKNENPTTDNDDLHQVALAFGADFNEKYPYSYSLANILEHVAQLHEQIDGLQQAVIDREEQIEQMEKPRIVLDNSSIPAEAVEWAKQATNFAYIVLGYALTVDGMAGDHLTETAEALIETSPVK